MEKAKTQEEETQWFDEFMSNLPKEPIRITMDLLGRQLARKNDRSIYTITGVLYYMNNITMICIEDEYETLRYDEKELNDIFELID